jgi:hypothetical protein
MSSISQKIGTIINFCSNDYPFLKHCIEKVKPFSFQVIVPVCDHFFDGTPEDLSLLERIYSEHPDVLFVQYPYDRNRLPYAFYGNAYWHNIARLTATYHLNPEIDFVLFLDTDEIVDTERFIAWIQAGGFDPYALVRFATYWYFREQFYQALAWEEVPVLVRKNFLSGDLLMRWNERWGIFDGIKFPKQGMKTADDGLPLFHHYSFVRTKEQMLKKVTTWGHCKDRDWVPLVEQEFLADFRGTDFLHGYSYRQVVPFIDLDLTALPSSASMLSCSHVRKLTPSDVFKIEIALTFDVNL